MPFTVPAAPPSKIYKRRLLSRMKEVGFKPATTFLRVLFNENPCDQPGQLSLSASREQITTLMPKQERQAFNPVLIALGGPDHLLIFQEGSTLMAQQQSGDPDAPQADDTFQITPVVFDINRSCRPRDGEPFFLKTSAIGNDTRLGFKASKGATRRVNITGPDHPRLPRFDAQFRSAFLKDLHEEVAIWAAIVDKAWKRNLATASPQWPAPLLTHGDGLRGTPRADYQAFLAEVAQYIAYYAEVPHPLRLSLTAPLFGQDGQLKPSIYIGCGAPADTTLAEQLAEDLINSSVAPLRLHDVMPVLAPQGKPVPVASDLHTVDSGVMKEPSSNHQMLALMGKFQPHHRKIDGQSPP